jgi:hypothetical protein
MSKIPLDECIPRPLAQYLPEHYVRTVPQMGWASISNGELIELAEADFDVFISLDKGILYQQNLHSTVIGFILLRVRSNRLEDILPLVPDILAHVLSIKAGDVFELRQLSN